jgi:hypothetical protein
LIIFKADHVQNGPFRTSRLTRPRGPKPHVTDREAGAWDLIVTERHLGQIRDRLAAFEIRYNAIARPFNWKFTRTDLADLLHRIDTHNTTQPHTLAA